MALDLPAALSGFASPMTLLTDNKVKPFAFSRPENIAKTVVFAAALCSAKMNHALSIGVSEGFVPFADAAPYGGLLAAKYTRAIDKLEPANNKLPVTNLSFAIFDSVVDAQVLARMPMKEVIRYRHESTDAREAFLEYLSALQWKANGLGVDANYDEAIEKLIATEIMPASRSFQNKMKTIGETFLGSLGKGALGAAVGGTGAVQLFGDLSMAKIMTLAFAAGAYIGKAGLDAYLAERAAKRECALTYLLALDETLTA